MPLESATLAKRRAAAQTALAELEAAQGAALLDGKDFNAALVADKRAELHALNAAEIELERRNRVATAQAEAELRASLRTEARDIFDGHLTAVSRAEHACKAMVAALADVQTSAAALAKLTYRLDGTVPIAIDPFQVKTFFSRLVAGELRALGGHSHFGDLKWSGGAGTSPDWAEAVQRYVTPTLNPIIEGEN